MIVIPAIDLKDGKCVRLRQGKMWEETVFSDYPEEMAERWYALGAERIHVVDLDGAHEGTPINREAIRAITSAVPVPIQLGGGIRDLQTVEAYLEQGIRWVVIGTAALRDPDFVFEAAERFPGSIILGIDGRGGKVAIEGWTEEVGVSPSELAKHFEPAGVSAIVYTDILRDGMKTGPNIQATAAVARSTSIPLIASGGISDLSDIMKVMVLEKLGVIGVITGRALYDGTVNLDQAISLCKGSNE